jgi:predicted murein hydrolase (TIGR00659 family)
MSEVLWVAATLAVYLAARGLYQRTRFAVLNPALVSIAAMIALLVLTRTPYPEYMRGGRIVAFWLGPAVVALGLPLAMQLDTVRRNVAAIVLGLGAGAVVGVMTAVGVAALAGATPAVVRSLAPRSATTPIAVAVAARLGGIPALSAMVSIVSGAIGGFVGVPLLRAIGVRSRLATGLALGAAAHGLGTARAADEGDVEGASSGMAMGVVGVLTALFAPVVLWLMQNIQRR